MIGIKVADEETLRDEPVFRDQGFNGLKGDLRCHVVMHTSQISSREKKILPEHPARRRQHELEFDPVRERSLVKVEGPCAALENATSFQVPVWRPAEGNGLSRSILLGDEPDREHGLLLWLCVHFGS